MSELNYGDNVEHLLYELSQYYEGEIKGSFEIRGETEDGVEGYEYIEVSLLADDAVNLIAELKAQRDALAANISDRLGQLAGAMLNRTLDSGSKQAVAYAECADMVAKFAAKLRAGEPS